MQPSNGYMRAMILSEIVSMAEHGKPLQLVQLPKPAPGPDEVLLQVLACGVCHTELDEIEGRTAPPALPVVLGHEVVGRVVAGDTFLPLYFAYRALFQVVAVTG